MSPAAPIRPGAVSSGYYGAYLDCPGLVEAHGDSRSGSGQGATALVIEVGSDARCSRASDPPAEVTS